MGNGLFRFPGRGLAAAATFMTAGATGSAATGTLPYRGWLKASLGS
jgi:hypothetical protein